MSDETFDILSICTNANFTAKTLEESAETAREFISNHAYLSVGPRAWASRMAQWNHKHRHAAKTIRELVSALERVRQAVATHMNQEGDDRCHLDDLKLYHDVLGVGNDPYVGALPPDLDMEESCRRYIRQRRCPGPQGVVPLPGDMTIQQLTEEVERLRQRETDLMIALERASHDPARIGPTPDEP